MGRLIWLMGPSGSGKDSLLLALREYGLFALDWQAHQFYYALGIEIDQWLASGLDVVVNGSRLHLAAAQQRYGERLLAVCLQVSPNVLAARLRRAAEPVGAGCLTLNNDGEPGRTLQGLLCLLDGDNPGHQRSGSSLT